MRFFQIFSMFFPWKRTSLSRLMSFVPCFESVAVSRSNCREHSSSSTEKRDSPSTRGDSPHRVVTVVISFQSSQCIKKRQKRIKKGDVLFNTRLEWKLWFASFSSTSTTELGPFHLVCLMHSQRGAPLICFLKRGNCEGMWRNVKECEGMWRNVKETSDMTIKTQCYPHKIWLVQYS